MKSPVFPFLILGILGYAFIQVRPGKLSEDFSRYVQAVLATRRDSRQPRDDDVAHRRCLHRRRATRVCRSFSDAGPRRAVALVHESRWAAYFDLDRALSH